MNAYRSQAQLSVDYSHREDDKHPSTFAVLSRCAIALSLLIGIVAGGKSELWNDDRVRVGPHRLDLIDRDASGALLAIAAVPIELWYKTVY